MTKLDWSKTKRPRGWSYEASPYRPATAMDFLFGGLERRPVTPASRPPPAITLDYLAGHGVNRIAIWCGACRQVEHRAIDSVAPDIHDRSIDQLGDAVRCDACGGSTIVSPFTESPVRNARSHL